MVHQQRARDVGGQAGNTGAIRTPRPVKRCEAAQKFFFGSVDRNCQLGIKTILVSRRAAFIAEILSTAGLANGTILLRYVVPNAGALMDGLIGTV